MGRGAVRVTGGRILDGLSYRGSVDENYLRSQQPTIVRG